MHLDRASLFNLGDALREKNPELVKKFEALQDAAEPAGRLARVIDEVLPCPLRKPHLFEEGIGRFSRGALEEAANRFQEVLRWNPQAYTAHHLLGTVCVEMKDYKEGAENYRRAIKIKPDYPQVYFDLGIAYDLLGRKKKAVASYKYAVPLMRDFAVAENWLTFSFNRLGRFQHWNRAREKHRIYAQACYMLGNAFCEFGAHPAARQAYKKAVQLQPQFARAFYQLGELHIRKLRNPKRAAKYLEKAEQLFIEQNDLQSAALTHQLFHPVEEIQEPAKAAEDWKKKGLRAQNLGWLQSAIDAYRMAIRLQPNDPEAYYNMGIAYGSLEDMEVNRIDRAIGAFRQAIRLKSDFIHAYIGLGSAYIRSQRLDEAIDLLSQARLLSPRESDVFYYLGLACRMAGQVSESIEHFKKAADLKPDSVRVHFNLGFALMDSGSPQEACETFQEVVRIKPDFADGHYMLGNLYNDRIIDPERALFHLKKAEKLYVKLEDHQRSALVRQLLLQNGWA